MYDLQHTLEVNLYCYLIKEFSVPMFHIVVDSCSCVCCVVDEVDPDGIGQRSLSFHGAVGVQKRSPQVPRLLLLHEEEELRGTAAETGPAARLLQIRGQFFTFTVSI